MKLPSRRQYLNQCVDRVGHYAALMQSRTGVDLSGVDVRDMRMLPFTAVKHMLYEIGAERHSEGRSMGPIVTCGYAAVGAILSLRGFFGNADTIAGHVCSTILFNTSKKMRGKIIEAPLTLDRTVVHELGHELWNSLGGVGERTEPRMSMMVEGFASYCDTVWFSDLYPGKIPKDYTDHMGDPDYVAGGIRMGSFVDKFGPEIMLEVPKRWRELDPQTPMSFPERISSTKEQKAAFEGEVIADLDD